jgi:hypothetical protein
VAEVKWRILTIIQRNSILCKTCGTETTIRTAIGHGSYQEFAFPCPRCDVEIRFGTQIDHKNVTFEFTKLINGEWGTGGPGKPEYLVKFPFFVVMMIKRIS